LAQLVAAQHGQVLRQPDTQGAHPDAWRFTVHAGGPQPHHLLVVADQADQLSLKAAIGAPDELPERPAAAAPLRPGPE
jgi:hypothetical protein